MSEERIFYVYILFRPWNMIPCYVGKGRGSRISDHEKRGKKHQNRHLANIFAKAGGKIPKEIFQSGLTEAEAFQTEICLISCIGRGKNGPLVNLTDGGEGSSGAKWTDEAKLKRSIDFTGKKRSPEAIEKSRLAHIGLKFGPMPEEVKKKISLKTKGRPSPNKGRKASAEEKAAQSKARTGRKRKPYTEQALANMKAAAQNRGPSPLKGIPRPKEVKEKISKTLLETNKTAEPRKRSWETVARQSNAQKRRWDKRREEQLSRCVVPAST